MDREKEARNVMGRQREMDGSLTQTDKILADIPLVFAKHPSGIKYRSVWNKTISNSEVLVTITGGGEKQNKIKRDTVFDRNGRPVQWPMLYWSVERIGKETRRQHAT